MWRRAARLHGRPRLLRYTSGWLGSAWRVLVRVVVWAAVGLPTPSPHLATAHLPYIGSWKNPVQEKNKLVEYCSRGFFIFGKAPTGPLHEFLPSADMGQVNYY